METTNPVAVDTETNWTDRYQDRYCMGVALSVDDVDYYIPVAHDSWMDPDGKNVELPKTLLMSSTPAFVYHNAKFDIHVLKRSGVQIPETKIYDTLLMAHLINEERLSFSLEAIGSQVLGEHKEKALSKIMQKDWDATAAWVMEKYACQDTRLTLQLYHAQKEAFEPYEKVWNTDEKFMLLLQEMESKGVPVDVDKARLIQKQCFVRLGEIQSDLGFDPAKTSKLHERLFGEPPIGIGLKPTSRTPGGKPQVNSAFLERCNHPVAGILLEWRRLQKQLTSYYNPYLSLTEGYGRIHASFKQHGTVTGRMSCADPNMQQIPRESPIKGLFLAEPGKQLWEIDFKNIEMRLAAVYCKQENLLETFRNEGDMHQLTADMLGISRQTAKIINFLIIYGGGWKAIVRTLGYGEREAKLLITKLRAGYPDLFATAYAAQQSAAQSGSIKYWTGRQRHFGWSRAYNKAFNAIVQGGAFDIVKHSMLRIAGAGVDIRSQVHDSVWIMVDDKKDVEEAEHIMSDWTEKAFGLKFSVESKRLN